jgi:hypothetical protein
MLRVPCVLRVLRVPRVPSTDRLYTCALCLRRVGPHRVVSRCSRWTSRQVDQTTRASHPTASFTASGCKRLMRRTWCLGMTSSMSHRSSRSTVRPIGLAAPTRALSLAVRAHRIIVSTASHGLRSSSCRSRRTRLTTFVRVSRQPLTAIRSCTYTYTQLTCILKQPAARDADAPLHLESSSPRACADYPFDTQVRALIIWTARPDGECGGATIAHAMLVEDPSSPMRCLFRHISLTRHAVPTLRRRSSRRSSTSEIPICTRART